MSVRQAEIRPVSLVMVGKDRNAKCPVVRRKDKGAEYLTMRDPSSEAYCYRDTI